MPTISEFKIGLDGRAYVERDDGSSSIVDIPDGQSKTLSIKQQVASTLVDAYSAEQSRVHNTQAHFIEVAPSVPSADLPTITGISATPATDLGTTPFILKPWGIDCDSVAGGYQLTLAEKLVAKRWVRGFSQGASSLASGLAVRAGASMATYGTTGSSGLNAVDNWGYDGALQYIDFSFDGDVFYVRILTGVNFWLWVNDRLISVAAGTNTSYNGTTLAYQSTVGGHGYVKIVFSSSTQRNIRLAFASNSQFGNLYCSKVFTFTQRYADPIEWVHFGDSFSQYSGVSSDIQCLVHYMHESFGRGINMINVAQGSTSFANPALNDIGETATAKAKFIQQFQSWKTNSPKIITALVGHNDTNYSATTLPAKVREFLTACKTTFPNAIVILFGANASPGIISSGADLAVENSIKSVCNEFSDYCTFVSLQDSVTGPFLRGTGRVGATNGSGNTDLYTTTDGTHPSQRGHKAYGLELAKGVYNVLKQLNK